MSAPILPPLTAGIDPSAFPEELTFVSNRTILSIAMAVIIVVGFGLRVNDLGAESLGEDELNKLQTVAEYRENGLSGKNGEHPFLMKGLQTLSISATETVNTRLSPAGQIREEAALRFPVALLGTLTSLLLFLLVSELFGKSTALIAAALWAVEPMAIGFDRVAKEDSLVLFFFLLTNLFWVRSQTAAERGGRWIWKSLAAGVAFAALMASKYYPHLLAILGAYYNVFKFIPNKRWNLEKWWLAFFLVMGMSFLILNPTIVLPETWREMLKFSSENRIGHDSYEFMGSLYRNQMSAWLSGVPWTFYYVFIAVKTSLSTLILCLIGLPLLFRKRLGDGRYLLFFWAFMWFLPFTFLGGKFTRYFTLVEPLLLISAAVAVCLGLKWLSARMPSRFVSVNVQYAVLALVVAFPLWNSISAAPHFRLFTNTIGGGHAAAGSYFPHDEFYDAATREIVDSISENARVGATVACETPTLFAHYAAKIGRGDLLFVSLSDKPSVDSLSKDDFIVMVAGRRYFSNGRYEELLSNFSPAAEIKIAERIAARIYKLDERLIAALD